MPRPTLITLNHVTEATQILTARGQSVTSRAVREVIGFGSFDTICKLLKQVNTVSPPEDVLPAASIKNIVPCQQDDRSQEQIQTIEDYRNLWHESASECAALREQLAVKTESSRRWSFKNAPPRFIVKEIFKCHFRLGMTDKEIAKLLKVELTLVEDFLLSF